MSLAAAKQVIEELAERLATLTGLSQRCLLDMVMRERLGSTGIGGGIAIPHAVHDDITRTIALFDFGNAGRFRRNRWAAS